MMDAYATGNTIRLVQSYADQIGLQSSAFVYRQCSYFKCLSDAGKII